MQLTPGQIESILCGVLVNGQPLTIPEIRALVRALSSFLGSAEVQGADLRVGFILKDSLNQILIERG